ncbi:MAG: hypothetical protein HY084_14150 [Gemmatimonadetes bacterium]|nr:hypothetical protein [Gemmatimonadota bacterium]
MPSDPVSDGLAAGRYAGRFRLESSLGTTDRVPRISRLALLAARSSQGFVQYISAVTEPFEAPFRGVVPSMSAERTTRSSRS